jgi:NodT family efflux transporter outer membrane factor (OMF) lipoprotein
MKRLLALALSGALLGGCVDTPSTTPSQIALKGDTLGLGAAPAPVVAPDWWTALGDPQLNGLVEQALKGSPTLAAALARVRAAQSELSLARALTYPQISLDGQEVNEHLSKNYIIPPPFGGTDRWVGTVQANLSWTLDFFGKQDAMVERARAGARAAGLDATAARLLLAGSVTQAYVALWRAHALVDVGEEAVKQREGILSLTQGRVRAGLDTEASQKQASALLDLAREDLTRAKAVREIAVHQIAALIGRGADAYDVTRPTLNDAALALPTTLPADLLARRADIAAAQARIDAAAFQGREVARKAFYPDINLIALAGTAAIGLGNLVSSSSFQYGGGAAIHLPIFDAGKLRADYAGATAELDAAVADYNEAVVTAVRQTADALTNLKSLEAERDDQRRALSDAQASFDLARERYHSGLSPQQTTLDAESLLIQARNGNATLAGDIVSARVTLLMAIGGGYTADATPDPNDKPDHPHE